MVRFNPQESAATARDCPLSIVDSNQVKLWFEHPDPDADISVTELNHQFLQSQSVKFSWFEEDHHVLYRNDITDGVLSEGDPVYALGYW